MLKKHKIGPNNEDQFMKKRGEVKLKKVVKCDRIEVISVTSQDLESLERAMTSKRMDDRLMSAATTTTTSLHQVKFKTPKVLIYLLLLLVVGIIVVITLCVVIMIKENSRASGNESYSFGVVNTKNNNSLVTFSLISSQSLMINVSNDTDITTDSTTDLATTTTITTTTTSSLLTLVPISTQTQIDNSLQVDQISMMPTLEPFLGDFERLNQEDSSNSGSSEVNVLPQIIQSNSSKSPLEAVNSSLLSFPLTNDDAEAKLDVARTNQTNSDYISQTSTTNSVISSSKLGIELAENYSRNSTTTNSELFSISQVTSDLRNETINSTKENLDSFSNKIDIKQMTTMLASSFLIQNSSQFAQSDLNTTEKNQFGINISFIETNLIEKSEFTNLTTESLVEKENKTFETSQILKTTSSIITIFNSSNSINSNKNEIVSSDFVENVITSPSLVSNLVIISQHQENSSFSNQTDSLDTKSDFEDICFNFGRYDKVASKCICLESTFGPLCEHEKPCHELKEDPSQCVNLSFEPLAHLICPVKFRCSTLDSLAAQIDILNQINFNLTNKSLPNNNSKILTTTTNSNVCWNNGYYDHTKAKCICHPSTYGKYCEYFKPCDTLDEDPKECSNSLEFNSNSYIQCPKKFRCSTTKTKNN